MAEIKSIGMEKFCIEVKLSVDKAEYDILRNHVNDLLILPYGNGALEYSLTTGKLGNSNRIMLPKKILSAHEIDKIEKKVPSAIFKINGDSYLLIKIKKSDIGIPNFGVDE